MRAKLPDQKASSSATACASTTKSTATARRPCSSCRPGASCIRASTRRRFPISASASAASPSTLAATASPTGRTARQPIRWRIASADALAVMDATAAGEAIVVGLSFGGFVACVLAAHHPERVKAAILAGTAGVIGPTQPHMTPSTSSRERDRFEGWDKYNRAYWLKNYPDFAEHFVRNIFTEPHSTRQIEDGIAWANETDGPALVKTVEARAIMPLVRRLRGDVSQDPLPRARDPWRQRPDPALRARQAGGRADRRRTRDHRAAATMRSAAIPPNAMR